MNRVALALTVLAGACASASAVVNTQIDVLVSTDGVNFSHMTNAGPGTTVQVLISVSYIGTGSPPGLASMVFQPTVTNFQTTDTPLPFANGGAGGNTLTPSGMIPDSPGQYGRISPWGRTNLGTATALTNFNNNSAGQPAGGWLRIAQLRATSWLGGAGNTTGGFGVPIGQLANIGRTTSDPAFVPSLTNIHVFRFGFTLNTSSTVRDMVIDIPPNGFGNRNSTTGEREVYWWGDMNEPIGSIRGTALVIPAHLVPGPGPLWGLGFAGLACGHRRR